MNSKIEKEIEEIVLNLYKEIEDNPKVEKLSGTHRNDIYFINNNAVLKVFKGDDKIKHYQAELDFVRENSVNMHLPKLVAKSRKDEDACYILYERINGMPLSKLWDHVPEETRIEWIKLIMEDLKRSHHQVKIKDEWANIISSKIKENLKKIKLEDFLKPDEIKEIQKAIKEIPNLLKNNYFVLLHGSITFDNIFYDMHDCIFIDYEDSFVGPIEYEISALNRISKYPKLYNKNAKNSNYANIREYINEFYPQINEIEHLEERLAIYDMDYYLSMLLTANKSDGRKIAKRLFKSALIVNKYSTLTYESIKNDSELMQYMELFISDGWILDKKATKTKIDKNKYRTMSIDETIRYKVGTSIEQANMATFKFRNLKLNTKQFALVDKKKNIHAFTLFKYQNKWYYYEHYLKKLKGIHAFNNINEAINTTCFLIKDALKMEQSELIETDIIPKNLKYDELIKYVLSIK